MLKYNKDLSEYVGEYAILIKDMYINQLDDYVLIINTPKNDIKYYDYPHSFKFLNGKEVYAKNSCLKEVLFGMTLDDIKIMKDSDKYNL